MTWTVTTSSGSRFLAGKRLHVAIDKPNKYQLPAFVHEARGREDSARGRGPHIMPKVRRVSSRRTRVDVESGTLWRTSTGEMRVE